MRNREFKKLFVLVAALCGLQYGMFAGTFRHIAIDGSFDDWAGVPLASSEAQVSNVVVGFKDVYVANDESYLYLRFSLYADANPFTSQQNLFFDTDNNPATGYSANGIGSEMLIQSGSGYRELNGNFNAGGVNGVDWLASPGGTGTEFEVRISRSATYADNSAPVFTNGTIAFNFESDETIGNEWFPSAPGGISYSFATESNAVVRRSRHEFLHDFVRGVRESGARLLHPGG